MSTEYRIGSLPDIYTGSQLVEETEEIYKQKYGAGVCEFLQAAYPEDFKRLFPGGIDECVATLGTAADRYFDRWKIMYPRGVVARAKATVAGSK